MLKLLAICGFLKTMSNCFDGATKDTTQPDDGWSETALVKSTDLLAM